MNPSTLVRLVVTPSFERRTSNFELRTSNFELFRGVLFWATRPDDTSLGLPELTLLHPGLDHRITQESTSHQSR
jgi:hypothetical protein